MFSSLNLFGRNSPAVIGIDWLQLYVEVPDGFINLLSNKYELVLEPYQTRQFKKVITIKQRVNDVVLGSIVIEPHSKIMQQNTGLLKIENQYLYQTDLKTFVQKLLNDLNLVLLNITRIDFFIDFEKFANGNTPETFIQSFISGQTIKCGKAKFQLCGNVKKSFTYNYLKFGSKTSEVNYYLYNKTLEMNEVKRKPYIIEQWNKNKLGKKNDVWRLEFSVKGGMKELIEESGECISTLKELKMLEHNSIKQFLHYLIQKNWQFATKENFEKDKNISRVKKIEFFNLEKCNNIYARVSEKKTSNRMDKVFIKKLLSLKDDFGQAFNYFEDNIQVVAEYFARTRDLRYMIT
jgi:hypothetical protein